MIRSFADKETERLWNRQPTKFPPDILRSGMAKLQIIHAAQTAADLNLPPGNRLERLKGDRDGQFSIRINIQWRVCFEWDAPFADKVEIVDYH